MDRVPDFVRRNLGIMLVVAGLAAMQSGCMSLLTTAVYLIKGTEVEPPYAGLKGKKVAVVCRPLVSLQYANSNAANEIAVELSRLLQQNVKKVHVIDQQKVAEWTDENDWEEFDSIGKALDADFIVGIDLVHFSLYQGQTLYQGKANVTVKVVDVAAGGRVVYEKTLPRTIYPPNAAIPTSERPEAEFRQQFVQVVADEIGRHFYPHDPGVDFAKDSTAL